MIYRLVVFSICHRLCIMQALKVCLIEHGAAVHYCRFLKSNTHLVQTQSLQL